MNIDLKNPVTILVAVAFGFGSQLWLAWLKRQMELDDSDPDHAAARVKRLSDAALRTLQVLGRLVSFGVPAILIVVGGILLAGDTLFLGIWLVLFGLTFLAQNIAELTGRSVLKLIAWIVEGVLVGFVGLAGVITQTERLAPAWLLIIIGGMSFVVGVSEFVVAKRNQPE